MATNPYIPIHDNDRRAQYTATASQTTFPYDFLIYSSNDIKVYEGDTLRTKGAGADQYTVTGVNAEYGGNVVFNTGRSAGVIVTIYGDIPVARETQYQLRGAFKAATVNQDFNQIVQMLQQLERNIGLCLSLPVTTTVNSGTLPAPSANKFLGWNGTATALENKDSVVSLAQFASGSVGSPGLAVNGDLDTGLYAPAANELALALGGATALHLLSSLAVAQTYPLITTTQIGMPYGSAGTPGLAFSGDADTGFYRQASNVVGVVGGGINTAIFTSVASAVNYLNIQNSATTVGLSLRAVGTDTNIWIDLVPKGTGGVSSTGQIQAPSLKPTSTSGIIGTTTNDAAATGSVGEYKESVVSGISYPATTQYGDTTSISLTAGDWDVTLVVSSFANGATVTSVAHGISTTSGNSATGLVLGSNQVEPVPPTASYKSPCSIPSYRMSLSGTTTVYAKMQSSYTVATPNCAVRLSARRVR